MSSRYLAIDIGAESGRAILGEVVDGVLRTEEILRFPNKPVHEGDTLRWDIEALVSNTFASVQAALQCPFRQLGSKTSDGPRDLDLPVVLRSVGVDTWAVDFVLLDADGELVEPPFHYRDARTHGMIEEACRVIPREAIYERTGIQFLPFNTLFNC